MEQQSGGVHKTYKYRLTPTPAQEQASATVLHCCRTLYNVALEQRKIWWERGQGQSATYYQQKAELPDLKASCSEYAEVNAQVLQDVILRVERTYKDFFRRVQATRQGAGKGKQHRAIHVSSDRAAITASPIRSMAAAPS